MHNYYFQSIKHKIIFNAGIYPFVIKKGFEYRGVMSKWKKLGVYNDS